MNGDTLSFAIDSRFGSADTTDSRPIYIVRLSPFDDSVRIRQKKGGQSTILNEKKEKFSSER